MRDYRLENNLTYFLTHLPKLFGQTKHGDNTYCYVRLSAHCILIAQRLPLLIFVPIFALIGNRGLILHPAKTAEAIASWT